MSDKKKSDPKSSPDGFSYGHSDATRTTKDAKPKARTRTNKSKSGATKNPSSPN